jgi:IS30 family transposase
VIVDAISISDRPAEAEDRAVPGHWEGDLLAGGGNTHIATLVERRSRFVILVKVPAKTTEAVVDALRQPSSASRRPDADADMGPRPGARRAQALHHRHRRAGLLLRPEEPLAARQQREHQRCCASTPKGTNLGAVTQEQLDEVTDRLNGRPRQTLKLKTPSYA